MHSGHTRVVKEAQSTAVDQGTYVFYVGGWKSSLLVKALPALNKIPNFKRTLELGAQLANTQGPNWNVRNAFNGCGLLCNFRSSSYHLEVGLAHFSAFLSLTDSVISRSK